MHIILLKFELGIGTVLSAMKGIKPNTYQVQISLEKKLFACRYKHNFQLLIIFVGLSANANFSLSLFLSICQI